MMFGGLRVDALFAQELMRAVAPMAVEAAQLAEQRKMERQSEHRRLLELELQQARYDASLAERRYAACDPDNRLIAATLEKNWETALRRVRDCEGRLDQTTASVPTPVVPDLRAIAEDLEAAWKNTNVTMRCRQQLVRAMVNEITVDIEEQSREIVLIIHWKGGQHSELRLRKPRTGEHACSTSDDALAVIRSMATRLVRPGHRGHAQPDEPANRTEQDLDGAQGQFDPACPWHSRLQVRREGWRLADLARRGGAKRRRDAASPVIGSASGSRLVSFAPSRLFRARRSRSVPRIWTRPRWWRRSRVKATRVTSPPRINFQCFQILEEEVHNDTGVAIGRMARSAALLVMQMRPSSTNRENAAQRLSM
jgi:hypothetical protein